MRDARFQLDAFLLRDTIGLDVFRTKKESPTLSDDVVMSTMPAAILESRSILDMSALPCLALSPKDALLCLALYPKSPFALPPGYDSEPSHADAKSECPLVMSLVSSTLSRIDMFVFPFERELLMPKRDRPCVKRPLSEDRHHQPFADR